MMRMIAGKRYYGDDVTDIEEAKRFREIHEETFKVAGMKSVGEFLPWFKSKKLENLLLEYQRKRDEFMHGLIEQKRRIMSPDYADAKRKKTLMEVLLDLQVSEPEYYMDEIIKGLILVMLQAGDTSVTAMESAL
ncbi:Cytochrome P450 [Melia azedarach]|uniref:Cytochrome P450 n=1 Tax=Melia azedarach TaxID=155640 RepID=A0ACC1WR24_MELAZ|nr:Cytochrome P450 [Melia azedarach]